MLPSLCIQISKYYMYTSPASYSLRKTCASTLAVSHSSPHLHHGIFSLVLTSSRLASLQLIQIPPTDSQTALILIHASLEVVDLRVADPRWLVVLIHAVLAIVLLGDGLVGWCLLGAAAAEEAADRVADAGADCNTAMIDLC